MIVPAGRWRKARMADPHSTSFSFLKQEMRKNPPALNSTNITERCTKFVQKSALIWGTDTVATRRGS